MMTARPTQKNQHAPKKNPGMRPASAGFPADAAVPWPCCLGARGAIFGGVFLAVYLAIGLPWIRFVS
jgi:hypothetical protein